MSQRVRDNGDGTITVSLKYPIESGKKTITEVTLRTECTAGDLEAMDDAKGREVEKITRLVVELSVTEDKLGLPMSAARKLRSADYVVLAREIGKIIGGDDEENEDSGK